MLFVQVVERSRYQHGDESLQRETDILKMVISPFCTPVKSGPVFVPVRLYFCRPFLPEAWRCCHDRWTTPTASNSMQSVRRRSVFSL